MPETTANSRRPVLTTLGFSLLLGLFVIAGVTASLQTGLTWDEPREQLTFEVNRDGVKGLLTGDKYSVLVLRSYMDRHYGIGFHAFAYPLQTLLAPYVEQTIGIDHASALLLAKHPVVFLMFGLSVVIFYRFLRLFVRDRPVALVLTTAYATYPYLFGHALLNVKDVPFMSVYLLCTYLSVRMAKHHLAGENASFTADAVALLVATAALASIRIPGLVILLQYLVTFAVADRAAQKTGTPSKPLLRLATVLGFPVLLLALVVAVYPILWRDTFDNFLDALSHMGKHPWGNCTLTWGECMSAQQLPPTYIPDWLLVKLPIFVLLGLMVVPFVLKRMIGDPLQRVAVVTLVFGSLYPLVAAILLRTPLYDETRQLLFIYPLLFLLASIAFYVLSRGLTLVAALLSLALFAWDDVQLHPYQYVYFNEGARFLDIDRLFETDYWGASGREFAGVVAAHARLTENLQCIYADPAHLYRPFVADEICVKSFDVFNSEPAPAKNYLIAAYTRSRLESFPNCRRIAELGRAFPLSNRKMTLAVAYRCRPI